MNRIFTIILLILSILVFPFFANGQTVNYEVNPASFCSAQDDEYSSAYHKDGIVFCSNRRTDLFVTFSTPEDKELFNMFYVPVQGDSLGKSPTILATELMTNFNDGPACFGANDSIIIFSRNNEVTSKKKDTKDDKNTLGLFTSYLNGIIWSDPEPFEYNSLNHHITMPSLSKDGSQLFFVSDMSGGFGGLDIYVCKKVNNAWGTPKNLGAKINTKGNESFPFISDSGELFFASDGHNGLGGLDIFSSKMIDGEWQEVLHINTPINSEFDDFGLITDRNFEKGYFSSNRNGSDDIFDFKTMFPQFTNCDTIKENQYCFLFYDEYYTPVDTAMTYYEWILGDGVKVKGKEAEHCYDGPGKYAVELNIIDKRTGEVFMRQTNYEFELLDFEQAYISCVDEALTKNQINFEASKTNLPSINLEKYFWDFGDGILDEGISVNHSYSDAGAYKVVLGVLSEKDSLGDRKKICVEKNLTVVKNPTALMQMKSENESGRDENAFTNLNFVEKQQLYDSFILKPKLIQITTDARSIMKAFDLAFFESFEKEKHFINSYKEESESEEIDLNSNPAKALALESLLNSSRKSNAKIHSIEKELQVLSTQFQYSFIEVEKQSFSDSAVPILNRLLKILLSNPLLELKIGFHVNTKSNHFFDSAGKVTQGIADYLIERGVEKFRLRTAVYEITNELGEENKNPNSLEFKLIKE
ncbi:PKD domain-containing protein [Labilibaculum sp. K2S]|uniref:PKD domain-containing protein n=1 Tax=Labilibaculum sp. K2S TaxID=3056386 RepID=UPI0025A41C4E|nr:PKD domain-containing protein [Labilibaculum sp. K2S]MDM8158719.1 PKD domain-containing protein [Labilibaculum sp. K2S]